MEPDAVRFSGEVLDATGASLGEARFWASAEDAPGGAAWSGWLHVTDLGTNELARGRYHVRSFDGWEGQFEPLAGRPSRVFETDLLPIEGFGDRPWPRADEETPVRHRSFWNEVPPRSAFDHSRFPDLAPLPQSLWPGAPLEDEK